MAKKLSRQLEVFTSEDFGGDFETFVETLNKCLAKHKAKNYTNLRIYDETYTEYESYCGDSQRAVLRLCVKGERPETAKEIAKRLEKEQKHADRMRNLQKRQEERVRKAAEKAKAEHEKAERAEWEHYVALRKKYGEKDKV